MLHNKFYRGLVVVLLIGFMLFLLITHKNYMELLEVNDDLIEQIDTNRENHDKLIQQWSDSYSELQTKYGRLLVEHEELKKSVKEVELPVYDYTEAEVELLAKCVQCEAGVQNEVSQKYITAVILNRLRSPQFADSIEGVIYEKVSGCPQFSVAYNGSMDECSEVSPVVLANVYSVLVNGSELPDYVMYFYSTSLKEDNWVKSLNIYDTVEGTIFCYEKGDKQ